MRALYDQDKSWDFSKRSGDHFDGMPIPWAKRGDHYHVWLFNWMSGGYRYQIKKRFELLVALNGQNINKLTYDLIGPDVKP